MSEHKKYLAFKLRSKTLEELREILEEHKTELSNLKVKKVVSGTQTSISQIGVIRKSIARILTIINLKKRDEIKSAFQNRKSIK
jgi:large subunit ribosomal protein L35e